MREQNDIPANEFANFTWTKGLRYLLGGLAIGMGLGAIGPYGTYQQLETEARLFFWISSVTLGWVEAIFFCYALRGFTHNSRYEGWPTLAAATVITTIPVYFQVLFIAELVKGSLVDPDVAEKVTIPSVYIIVLFCMLVQWLVIERWPLTPRPHCLFLDPSDSAGAAETQESIETPAPSPEAPATPKMVTPDIRQPEIRLKEMPKDLTGHLLCIRVEDHYLRLFTTDGEGLILKRMKDAVLELSDCDGLQVHRSWWVARHAVQSVETRNRQKMLMLSNGLEVPVSRTYLASLKANGWGV